MTLDVYFWISCLALGSLSGVLAGMFGIGGGAVMVPVLSMLFDAYALPHQHVVHLALGTSMATIIFTALSSLRAHHARGAVLWEVLGGIVPGVMLGTFLGTRLAAMVSSRALATFFGCFLIVVAAQMALNLRPKASRELPGRMGLVLGGSLIGGLSSLVAVGGGTMTVPWLTWCNVPVHKAIGTSAALGLPIAFFGTLGYLWNGYHAAGLPWGSTGYVHLPTLGCLVIASMITAPLGATLVHRLPVPVLKRFFALLLLALAARMLVHQ